MGGGVEQTDRDATGRDETGHFPALFLDASSPCLFNNFPSKVTFKAPIEVGKLSGTSLTRTRSHSSEVPHRIHHAIWTRYQTTATHVCLQLVPGCPTEAATLQDPGV